MIRTRPLYDAGEMRAADAGAITEIGIPGAVLMERAGLAAAREILSTYAGTTAAVVCGGGNNGGDGFVVARHLHTAGWEVECLLAADPAGLPDDARRNHSIAARLGVRMHDRVRRARAAARRRDRGRAARDRVPRRAQAGCGRRDRGHGRPAGRSSRWTSLRGSTPRPAWSPAAPSRPR